MGSRRGERGRASVIGVELSFDGGTRCSVAEKPCGKKVFREVTFLGALYDARLMDLQPCLQATFCREKNMRPITFVNDLRSPTRRLDFRLP